MMKELLKDMINPLADGLGIYDLLLRNLVFARAGWVILMYHRVVPGIEKDPFGLGMCVQTSRFEDHLKFVKQRFTVITVDDAIKRMRRGLPLPRNALSITFDDGYEDFADNALPALRRQGLPATLYTVTGGLETPQPFWWDEIIQGVSQTSVESLSLGQYGDPAGPSRLYFGNLHRRSKSLRTILDWLWTQPPDKVHTLVNQILVELGASCGLVKYRLPRRLDLETLAAFDPAEVDVQAHTVSHPNLVLLDPERILFEMTESRRVLEEALNRPVFGFAYPAGFQNEMTRNLAEQAGFAYAAGTYRGINRNPMNLFDLQRIGMPDHGAADIKRCLGAVAGRGMRPTSHHRIHSS